MKHPEQIRLIAVKKETADEVKMSLPSGSSLPKLSPNLLICKNTKIFGIYQCAARHTWRTRTDLTADELSTNFLFKKGCCDRFPTEHNVEPQGTEL